MASVGRCSIVVFAVLSVLLAVASESAVDEPPPRTSFDLTPPCRRRTVRQADPGMPATSAREASGLGDKRYAVVIDAGSSGSRVRVYRWTVGRGSDIEMRDIESLKPTLKLEPGLSSHEDNRTTLKAHISRLVQNASAIVPTEAHTSTNIYVMATAGMRLLLEEKMNDVVHYIDSLMRDSTVNPFNYFSSTDTRILSGEEEGVFAWITVNYLVGSFDRDDKPVSHSHNNCSEQQTVGILEMGGASTQIAFAPCGNVLADKFPVTIGRHMHSLYVHSYLYYGQNYVEKWIKERLVKDNVTFEAPNKYNNPCMLRGDMQQSTSNKSRVFVGTGNPSACIALLKKLVYKAEGWQCHPKPCSIGSFYQPTIPPRMKFYAVGSFIHTLKSIGALHKDGMYVPSVGYQKAVEFCNRTLQENMDAASQSEKQYTKTKCLIGLYMAILLNHGYGFANDSHSIYVLDKIKGQSPDWTLGAVLYENAQSSCHQIQQNAGAAVWPVVGQPGGVSAVRSSAATLLLAAVVAALTCTRRTTS